MDVFSGHKAIRKAVFETRLFDTHEHLPQEEERLAAGVDVLATLFPHYASSDLVSAGMSEQDLNLIRDVRLPLEERLEKFALYWKAIQNTGYARAVNIAIRDLYGLDEITRGTCSELEKRMKKANRKGLYRWVLKEKSGVEISILDSLEGRLDVDRDFFAPVRRFDDFIFVKDRGEVEALARRVGVAIHSLADLVKALEVEFTRLSGTIVGVKLALAYRRIIHFEKTTFAEAEDVFNKIYAQCVFKRVFTDGLRVNLPEALSFEEAKPLQDFMVHRVIQLAIEHRLPIQIHTGLQEGNENIITNSNPTHLTNLLMEYREAKFDIFHGGYPYTGELTALAKNFPNVYVDMCWLHIISPHVARSALSEWLDTVPGNKILGFGGDYRFVEGVYGHSVLAREGIGRVLVDKVENDGMSESEATYLAKRILRDNGRELFFPEKP